jgi:uncharacterized membrane protein YoaT (DUF817 family)
MIAELKKHPLHFLVLAIGMLVHVGAFFGMAQLISYRHLIVASAILWYLVWAIAHHYLENDLSKDLLLEYVLIGCLCLVLVWSLY